MFPHNASRHGWVVRNANQHYTDRPSAPAYDLHVRFFSPDVTIRTLFMKNFEIANLRNSRGNGFQVIQHVITRVNPEIREKYNVEISRLSICKLIHRADLCSKGLPTSAGYVFETPRRALHDRESLRVASGAIG
jgi:hypothetical protein